MFGIGPSPHRNDHLSMDGANQVETQMHARNPLKIQGFVRKCMGGSWTSIAKNKRKTVKEPDALRKCVEREDVKL